MSIKTLLGWIAAVAVAGVFTGCGSPSAPTDDASVVVTCTSHADCDDERFCTGVELCMPSSPDALANGCLLGTLPCMAASCDEAGGRCVTGCADNDGDSHTDASCGGDDCDDNDGSRFPGNVEVCDAFGHDEDCDPCTVGVTDVDMDLFVSAACANTVTEAPSPACGIAVVYDATAGSVHGLDCNDATDMIKPGQAETCNNADDDCDGRTDENLTLEPYWPDVDMDLAGDENATPTLACARPEGMAPNAGDCDDLKPEVRPFGTELCDGLDNDCDDEIDEQSASYTFYRDLDGDGVGSSSQPTMATTCEPPTGYSALAGDCNDNDELIYPGAEELCDRVDNNCSLVLTPGGVATDEDADDDGHAPVGASCTSTRAGTFPADDCDETSATVYGGAPDFCSGIDEDCDSDIDEDGAAVCGRGDTCDGGCLSGRRLSVGVLDTCAVLSDGELACWGSAGREVPVRVSGVTDVEQVTNGSGYTCVRLVDRTVRCWGDNDYGQLGVGHAMPVAGVVTPLGLGEVLAVDAGNAHTCALKPSGEVWCWGDNDVGQLGLGHTNPTTMPTHVTGVNGVVELRVRSAGGCARTGTGHVYCWGLGPVGDGVTSSSLSPVRASLTGVLELAADFVSTAACARQATGWSCWGSALSVGTGVPGTVLTPTALSVPGGADQIIVAASVGCALRNGSVSCWGDQSRSTLGQAVRPAAPLPATAAVTVPLTRMPSVVDCSYNLCCGLVGDDVTCWGSPEDGKLGDGRRDGTSPNVPVGLSNVSAVAVGVTATCAIDDAGLQCWGTGDRAGFADGLTRSLPQVLAPSGITHVSLGSARACTLDDVGAVRCWGDGMAGDVALTYDSRVPVIVDASSMGPASAVVVGGGSPSSFSCALDAVGAAWCWGGSTNGVCGNATDTCDTPVPVSGGLTFSSLSLGHAHVCGVTTDGDLYCWGVATHGRLGNGTTSGYADTPQQVQGVGGVGFLTDITHVEAGTWTTCALRSDGHVLCFGYGNAQALGNGSTSSTSTPVMVTGLSDANMLSCGGFSCLARKPDGTWVGWGSNDAMQLGIVGTAPVPTPQPAAFGLELSSIHFSSSTACGIDSTGVPHCWGASDLNLRAFPLVTVVSMPPPI